MALCINTFSELALRSPSVFDDSFLLVYDPKIPLFFPHRRVSIILGRVVTMSGQGLRGFIRCNLGIIRDGGLLGYIWGYLGFWKVCLSSFREIVLDSLRVQLF